MSKTFKVYLPKGYSKLIITGVVVLCLVPVVFCLIEGFNLACIITFAILLIPFLIAALWSCRFRITVRQDTITVRRTVGKEYSFNTGEITKVVRRVNINSGIGTMAKITIYTKSKHVSVESLMRGCDKMDSYITENVDPQKIVTKEKIWNANKTDY